MRRTGRSRSLLLATAILALADGRAGCGTDGCSQPVTPAILWDLVAGSQLVVLADVAAVTDCSLWKGLIPPWECRRRTDHLVAQLKVHRTFKLDGGWVRSRGVLVPLPVRFEESFVCPGQPRYERGTTVLAFLTRKGADWETTGLALGLRPAGSGEAGVYEPLLAEALRLQSEHWIPPQAPADWVTRAERALAEIDQRVLAGIDRRGPAGIDQRGLAGIDQGARRSD